MKNITKKNLFFRIMLVVLAVTLLVPSASVSAVSEKTDEIGYETYTYWYDFTSENSRKAVYSKPMYEVKTAITNDQMGNLDEAIIEDVHVSPDGKTFVLDGGTSRVLVFDKDYSLIKVINKVITEDGSEKTFFKSRGIFVDSFGFIYIADTENRRVLKCDYDGKLIREFLLPDSHLIPEGFNYKPIKVAVDEKGYTYILSLGSYYGAILYSPEDEFLGFYGSNDVAVSVGQALKAVWDRLFVNNEKRAGMTSVLPYTFTDLWIDAEGFVYTATGAAEGMAPKAQIKRLNPGGTNILPSEDVNFADEGSSSTILSGPRDQNIFGVAVDKQGFIYTIDKTYGRVFIYDSDCKMMSAFGGGLKAGEQDGTFHIPSAIAYNLETDEVLVTDSYSKTLTVFSITDYGRLVKSAQAKTVVGDYEEAMEEWSKVIVEDRNCQLAYAGLSKAYYVLGEKAADEAVASQYYHKAIELAEQGFDRETYSLAYSSIRTEYIRDNFTWIIAIVVVAIGAVIFWLVYSTKNKLRLVKNEKVHIATTLITHPFENFRELKEKSLTSIPICLVIIALYYVFTVMETTMGGFAFVYFDPSGYNALLILAKTAGLVLLWTVSNWAVCTLLGGKGKMKEIFSVISYSLIPLLISSVIYVIASNLLVPDEATFLSVLTVVCTLYFCLLIAAGSMVIHDYGFGKFIGTTILTLLGCGIVVFLLITIIILLQQTGGFLATIYSEILRLF